MCGSSGTSAPTIQRNGFNNTATTFANKTGTMNTAVDAVTLTVATGSAECAPVTEFFNANAPAATQDLIFFGVNTLGNGANCAGAGCVMSINATGTPGTLAILSSIEEVGGPSGIIVDNNGTVTGRFRGSADCKRLSVVWIFAMASEIETAASYAAVRESA
jgi:hypothetical protein